MTSVLATAWIRLASGRPRFWRDPCSSIRYTGRDRPQCFSRNCQSSVVQASSDYQVCRSSARDWSLFQAGRARTHSYDPVDPQWTWNNEPGLITSDHLLLFEAAVFDAAGQVVEPFAFDDEGQDEGRVGGGGDDARSRLADPDVVADGQFAHLVGHAALLEGPGRRLFLAVGPRAAAAPIHWRQLLLSVLCTELTNTRDCLYSMALTTVPLILSFFLLTPLQLVRLIHHSHETVSS